MFGEKDVRKSKYTLDEEMRRIRAENPDLYEALAKDDPSIIGSHKLKNLSNHFSDTLIFERFLIVDANPVGLEECRTSL
jgi:hypothetical protein